jgi:pyruvate carboxylase subunit B
LEQLRKEAEQMKILKQEEDLLTYALYPNTAPNFLREKMGKKP